MQVLRTLTFIAISIFVLATAASGAAKTWNLDKAHANIYFSVDHIFSKVNGHFNEFTTDIQFDPADLDGSRFNFDIQVASIDTNISKRDKHLQSEDFFDAATYPAMTFVSTRITDKGDGAYDVVGTLTNKGQAYDFALPLKLEGIKEHPAKKGTNVVGFNGRFTIDRLSYGVGSGKFYDMGIVGKDVDVFVSLELLDK